MAIFPNDYIHYHHVNSDVRIDEAGITGLHSHNQTITERGIKTACGIDSMICIIDKCASALLEYQERFNLEEWEMRVLKREVEKDRALIRDCRRIEST